MYRPITVLVSEEEITMKKQLSLLLVFVLCLTLFGCGENAEPTGELDPASLPMEEALVSSSVVEEEITSQAEEIASEDVASMAAETSTQTQATASEPDERADKVSTPSTTPTETVSSAPKTETESAPEQTKVTSVVAFNQPPEQTIFTHDEYTREDFIAWLNSEEAMTEENGAFRDIVNLYRQRGSVLLASLPESVTSNIIYSLYSSGKLAVLFKDISRWILIEPVDSTKSIAAQGGIASYFTARGETVLQNNALTNMVSSLASSEKEISKFISLNEAISGETVSAVYEIQKYILHETLWSEKWVYSRRLHWFEHGFHVTFSFGDTSVLEETLTINDTSKSLLSQLQFENAALTAAPSVVSTPLETE